MMRPAAHSPHGLFRALPHSIYSSVLYRDPIHSATALETHTERKPIHIHRRYFPYSRAYSTLLSTGRPYRGIALEGHAELLVIEISSSS